jgi:hypothetical protein
MIEVLVRIEPLDRLLDCLSDASMTVRIENVLIFLLSTNNGHTSVQ